MRCELRFGIACLLLLASQTMACRKSPKSANSQTNLAESQQRAQSGVLTPDEQSCKAFVQDFYDWYWNRFADAAEKPGFGVRTTPVVEEVLRERPPVLAPVLLRELRNEEAEMERTHEIGNLDFDPFLNSQDPRGKYQVQTVKIANETCEATMSQRHIVALAQHSANTWVFTNFRYGFFSDGDKARVAPDSDLLSILGRN